jgi:hypothetical protein
MGWAAARSKARQVRIIADRKTLICRIRTFISSNGAVSVSPDPRKIPDGRSRDKAWRAS